MANLVGKHALVLTIVECKGLEFQDVFLYNFLGSSPSRNQRRIIYDYRNELDLLNHTLPRGFPSFNVAKHNILCFELKQLYVAVTRTTQRLWICENFEELSKPMFVYRKKKCLVQVKKTLAHAMQVASSPEKWKSRGMKLYHEHNYELATMCFERAGDTYWQKRSKAAGLRALADHMQTSNSVKARCILREAAEIYDAIGKADSAARCFSDLGEYETAAARIYLNKCGESALQRAVECFSSVDSSWNNHIVVSKSNKYIMGSFHGTTILWYQTPTEILVGVDSQSTRTYINKDPENRRTFEYLESLATKKFVDDIEGVYLTLCGDGDRCEAMVKSVKMRMFAKRYTTKRSSTLEDVCEAATDYFRKKPKTPKDKISTVFICGWKSDLNKYEVYAVGDKFEAPTLMLDKVFGCGSGYSEALHEMESLGIPIDENVMKDKLIQSYFEDPHTGGTLKVISLKGGKHKTKYEGRMIDELHNPVYANILFDHRSMFVIIYLTDAENLSLGDLVQLLERFDESISTDRIYWLCFPGDKFCVYRVILSSPECCHTWFNSCGVWREPVRRQRYTNEKGVSCDYYLTYARNEILARARSMVSFDDLA